jgi:hypothetical protein
MFIVQISTATDVPLVERVQGQQLRTQEAS